MAAMNGVQENYYQQLLGTSSSGCIVGQITDTANEKEGLKNEGPHSGSPHSSVLDTAGRSKNNEKYSFSNTEHEEKAKHRTSEIPDCKLHLNSPSERESRLHSRGQSHRRSRSPSGSSSSGSRSRTYYSRSRSSNRSGSHSRRYRRSSRSRSRSLGSRYRRHRSRSHRRQQKSPRRYRSRSRSRSHAKVNYGRYRSRSRSRSRSRGRRYHGFVRRPYPATFKSWRSRSRSRSQSPLRLTEKDRRELLEIAKANAAKALGKSVDLPPSLKKDSWLSDTLHRSVEADSGKLNKQSRNLNSTVPTEVSPKQGANLFSTNRAVVHPVLNKQDSNLASSQKKEEPKKAQGQWIPIQCQRSVNLLR